MARVSEDDLDRAQLKPRPKGTLPYLPDLHDVTALRAWLTLALRPGLEWEVQGFDRAGIRREDPCALHIRNGRESRTFRFDRQADLITRPRETLVSVSSARLAVPHLTDGEREDLWVALVAVAQVLSEHDSREDARRWVIAAARAALPLTGFTLVPDGRHDGLMAMRNAGEFTRADAIVMLRPDDGDPRYVQRPTRFIDKQTADQWLRLGETAAYVRWVLGVEPLSYATLKARLAEIAIETRPFEDYRPPHPKLTLLKLTSEVTEALGAEK